MRDVRFSDNDIVGFQFVHQQVAFDPNALGEYNFGIK